jgi:hypothetical protein
VHFPGRRTRLAAPRSSCQGRQTPAKQRRGSKRSRARAHRRIRRRDQGRAVGDESASRNGKFESTPLQRRVSSKLGSDTSAMEPGTRPLTSVALNQVPWRSKLARRSARILTTGGLHIVYYSAKGLTIQRHARGTHTRPRRRNFSSPGTISPDYVIHVVNGITGVAAVAAAADLFLDLRHCVIWDTDLGALLRTSQ